MPISTRLSSYLDSRGMQYEVCAHEHSHSSAETARNARVTPNQLAKSVILEDGAGFVMAVVPADKSIMLRELSLILGRRALRLSGEERLATMFEDCERGAVPPVGMAWGIETIVDETLEGNDIVYLEGGDHERLLRMSHDQFHELMRTARHGRFCKTPAH